MTYSLVNMPVVGFDLCRLAGGTELAEILLRTLKLDEPGLRDLARAPRPVCRRPVPAPTLSSALHGLQGWSDGSDPTIGPAQAVHTLERSTIGDFDALVRLVRDDILSWTWHEVGSVRWQLPEAVTVVDLLAGELANVYGHPAGGRSAQPPDPHGEFDLGPCGPGVRRLLTRLTSMTGDEADQLRAAATRQGARTKWSVAVHDASWAVYLTDRLRPAAAAQLMAVRAFAAAGLTARDAAYGVWNAVSGAVQATVVGDLLAGSTLQLLVQTCDEVLGTG